MKLNLLNQIKYFYGLNSSKSIDLLNDYFNSDLISDDDSVVAALQQNLVDTILKDPHLDRFIGSRKFRQSFLKATISIVERLNVEVNQEIYEKLLTLINERDDEERSFLLFYDLNYNDSFFNSSQSQPIIVEQSRAIIANGTTGLHVWPACFQLINYLDRNRHLISRK